MTNQESFFSAGSILRDRYSIDTEIGRGGYSVVYKAQDMKLGTTVAIKLMVPPPVAAISAKERLRREVIALQKLHHPSILRIYDLYEEGPWSFIIMDYIEGENLEQHISKYGPLTEEHTKKIGQQIAEGLALAHQASILHRDVKPQNIMITRGDQAILTDFGSAKIEGLSTVTATGAFVGTLDYLAPEVFNGVRADARSDVFSLGMSLYFTLVGSLPKSDSKHLPPNPREEGFSPGQTGIKISSELDQIVARATMAEPSRRFHTIEEMAKTLAGESLSSTRAPQSQLKFCLRCGGQDLLDLTVCPSCRSQTGNEDTCIFIEEELGEDSKKHVRNILKQITGLHHFSTNLTDTIKGTKTLLRVTKDAAPGIVAKLRSKQIPVYSIPFKKTFSKVPFLLRVIVLANFSIALWAGLKYSIGILIPYWFLYITTKNTIFTPLIRPNVRALNLPPDVEASILKTFAILPAGPTRDLFAEIARTGSGLYDVAKKDSFDPLLGQKICSSLSLSGEVATTLSQLDQNIIALSKQVHANPSQESITKILGKTEAHRDKLVQKLLELLSAIATININRESYCDSAISELDCITKELEEDSRIQVEAEREVREYLESNTTREESLCEV